MQVRSFAMAMALAVALPAAAAAAPGQVTGSVNLRAGPSTGYPIITAIPAGARIDVRSCSSWCSVGFAGYSGWVSASYVAAGAYRPVPRYTGSIYYQGGYRPPPPRYGYHQRPWWDAQRHAWYDGRRWYFNGHWYDKPSGFSVGFGFSG